MTINELSRQCYRCARDLRNVQAVHRTVETGSLAPLCKRCARRYAYRGGAKSLRKVLRLFGL